MKKRIISVLLALCLCTALLPTTALATDYAIYSKEPVVFQVSGDVLGTLKSDNSLWTWGRNSNGAVGNGKGFENYYDFQHTKWIEAFVDTPYKVLDNVKTYEGGTWAIKTDNSLWVWGETAFLLGLSDDALTAVPQKYMDNIRFFNYGMSLEAPDQPYAEETLAEYNMYLVKTDGSLWTWSRNGYSETGDGTIRKQTAPVKVMDGVRCVRYVEGSGPIGTPYPGYGHVFVLKEDDSLWGWGADAMCMNDPRYGVSNTTLEKYLDNVKSICGNDNSIAAITKNGSLYIWNQVPTAVEGSNHYTIGMSSNQGSSGADHYYVDNFYLVAENVREVHIPRDRKIIYVTNSNEVYNWGFNHDGYHETPTKLMDGVSTVASSSDILYLCKTNGDLLRYDGQVYDRDTGTMNDSAPRKVLDGAAGVYYCASNSSVVFAIKTDGSLWGCEVESKDISHALMGKAGSGWPPSETFVHLMDGVKLPYTAQPVQPPVPTEATVEPFTDVKVSAYYAEPVKWAVDRGVTVGTSATTFSPDATCTKAQILTFIWRVAGSPTPSLANPFTNLSGSEYYAKAAVWAYSMGMVSGTVFDANKACTRAMTMDYLWKQAGSPTVAASGKFTDVSSSAAYATAVAWAVDNGVTVGTSNTTFSPDGICTRGQIMTFLYRAEG